MSCVNSGAPLTVIPAQAGIQERHGSVAATELAVLFCDNRAPSLLDSGLRRNDGEGNERSAKKLK
jgi:hypothetical protein